MFYYAETSVPWQILEFAKADGMSISIIESLCLFSSDLDSVITTWIR